MNHVPHVIPFYPRTFLGIDASDTIPKGSVKLGTYSNQWPVTEP